MSDNILTVEIGYCQIYLRAHLDPTHLPGPPRPFDRVRECATMSAQMVSMAKIGMTWRWLAACALLMAEVATVSWTVRGVL